MRIAVVGTELGPLSGRTGALERVVLGWAAAAERLGVAVARVEAGSSEELGRVLPRELDAVVLNNRPLWARYVRAPVAHVLHNYPDAWGAAPAESAAVRAVLQAGRVGAVSRALAHHVETAYRLDRQVLVVAPEVEQAFFSARWRGRGGPVLFPSRLLEKKGVRLFAEVAEMLARRGHRAVAFAHHAPFRVPTTEQKELLSLLSSHGSVELVEPPATRTEMAERFAGAAVVLCPSRTPEGLGLAVLEAQAVGTPVVTSGRGGLAEATVPPNEIVESDDPAEWCEAAIRATRRGVSAGPPAEMAARHSTAAAARSFLALLAEFLARPAPPGAGS